MPAPPGPGSGGRPRREPIPLIGAFESTYQPVHDRDVTETTGHHDRWHQDLALLATCGVSRLRYPVRWHRIETEPGRYDWRHTDEVLGFQRDHGFRPIVDLVHHTSYPAWLTEGFCDPRFPGAYLRYVEAFCRRYPWVEEVTLFNEPFSTLFLCSHEAIWPPYRSGMSSFAATLCSVLPAVAQAAHLLAAELPRARHVWVDACERHTGEGRSGLGYRDVANDRRFAVLDAVLGRLEPAEDRPFVRLLLEHGGEPLLAIDPAPVDVVGLDYYAHCQWHFMDGRGEVPSPCPPPLADVIEEYAERYERPVMLTETNIRGFASDRASWLKYTLEQCEVAVDRGVPLEGFCWFPFVDSCDWDTLLFRCEGNVDPVGVFSVGEDRHRHPSSMSVAYAAAGHGRPSAALPAYRFLEPVATWVRGWMSHMAHWEWRDPPAHEIVVPPPEGLGYEPLRVCDVA